MTERQGPKRFETVPRFRADLPWIGPIIGDRSRARFQIAGAVDPARMNAFGAAFVPVVVRDRRLIPIGAGGKSCTSKDVGWIQPAERDARGWFRIDVPVEKWHDGVDGVLVALVYNESLDVNYRTLGQAFPDVPNIVLATHDCEIASDLRAQAHASAAGRPAPVQLPPFPEIENIVAGIAWALDDLLMRDAEDLLPGVAQVVKPAAANDLCFALGSCQYPTGLLEEVVATASYARLGHVLDARRGKLPRALLLVGDQIYVDGTAGLFDPTAGFDRFVRPYEIYHRLPKVRDVTRRLPTYMLLDDHEIVDNWEPRCDDVRPDPAMVEGRQSYMRFERAAGPPPEEPRGDSTDPMWYRFDLDGFPFFMADTRTERTARSVLDFGTTPMRGGDDRVRIMSHTQFAELCDWLAVPCERPKFVASPSILLPRHRRAVQHGVPASALHSDGWDGYPGSFYHLLGWIGAKRIPNVVFLSGDEHLSCVARVTIAPRDGGAESVIHSVHSSPLFGPFPFANSVRQDLIANEDFDFEAEIPGVRVTKFHCRVQTKFAALGDGFALLRVFRRGTGPWLLSCSFDRDQDVAAAAKSLRYRL
jgi:cholesterol oxidase